MSRSNDIAGLTTSILDGVTATEVGLGNVTNESKATMFTSPTFTGDVSATNIKNASSSSNNLVLGSDGSTTITNGTLTAGTLGSSFVVPASVGGVMVFLEKFTADNSVTEKIFNLDSYTHYNKYLFGFNEILPATDQQDFSITVGTSSSSFETSYKMVALYGYWDGSSRGEDSDAYNDSLLTCSGVGNDTGYGMSGQVYIFNPVNSSKYTKLNAQITYVSHTNYVKGQTIGGFRTSAGDEPYIKFKFDSGNLHSGTITLYGIKDA